ncbi:uncharacterized protein LOC125943391 [Dermacentor silvarum]|uniref:uncharacterized protein LOC125943391 n=1 Tax=Dermacentor silvarum TaxID=543639 RepID=UPI002100D9B3|nr:uncharacterized protein LOC125943391 [Dermacentor silvarum]
MHLSAYARGLDKPERLRYDEKVHLCGGVDPLQLKDAEHQRDVGLLPRVDFADIKNYLVHGTSFVSREQLKAYKSMEGHNNLTSGWVQQPCVKALPDGMVVVVGKMGKRPSFIFVRHSQSFNEKPLAPCLLIKEDGEVQAARCTCKAGLGEACSHIAAVLFYIEAVVKKRDSQVCTEKTNAWLPPSVRFLEGKEACKVSFASSAMKRRMGGEEPLRKRQKRY